MKKRLLVITLSILFSGALIAQGNQKEKQAEEAFDEYFELPRETIFLHLNKDTYITGEDVWFKGYIYDRQESIPFKETSNVYVGIYDSMGKQIDKKLYLAKSGYLQGNIAIDSTFISGSYYLKASTNWMKNFREDDAYVQKIKILNKKPLPVMAKTEQHYDVQFLPEGGNFIAGISNTVGVKAIDIHGYGIAIKEGIVSDENGNEVAQFGDAVFGMAKFGMKPSFGKQYTATLTFADQKVLKVPLPLVLPQGINIQLNNDLEDKVIISLGANLTTRNRLKGKRFYLLVHRDGIAQKIDLTFDNKKTTNSFTIAREILNKGVNIVTLFDENATPVLERLLFNTKGIASQDVEIAYETREHDSLQFSVLLKNKVKGNLSISVLPEGTVSYGHKENILSTFYLKPYLKGFVENPAYYFTNVNKKKRRQLDVLLLTQGWSKFNWNTILNSAPKQLFVFERGITLNGTLNESNLKASDKIFVYPTKNNDSEIIEVASDRKKFSIVNYFLEQGEELKVSLLTKNKKLLKPRMYMSIANRGGSDILNNLRQDKFLEQQQWTAENNTAPSFKLSKETIRLNEVVVTKKVKKRLADDNSNIPNYLKKKVTEVDESILRSFPLFLDVIRARGYDVQETLEFGTTSALRIASRRDGRPVRVILDGAPLPELNFLVNLTTDKIESFWFDKIGALEGARNGRSEVIYLYTRRGGRELGYGNGSVTNSFTFTVENGFEPKKQFYTPKYPSYFDTAFQKYGVIHWAPEVITNKDGSALFNILSTGLEKVSFFVEGMAEDGSLFSTIKTIQINPNN